MPIDPRFQLVLQVRQYSRQNPVDQRSGKIHGENFEGASGNQLCLTEQLRHLNGGCQRRVLDQRDKAVAQRWQGRARRLRQDGPAQSLRAGHADTGGSFPLAALDGADRGTQDFAGVGGHVQREADQGSRQRIKFDAQLRQAVIDHEQLHQQRRAAKERHVDAGDPAHQFEARQPHQRQAEAHQQAEEHSAQAQDDRVVRALEQKGRGVQRKLESFSHY